MSDCDVSQNCDILYLKKNKHEITEDFKRKNIKTRVRLCESVLELR